jgi:hypothetical protein
MPKISKFEKFKDVFRDIDLFGALPTLRARS